MQKSADVSEQLWDELSSWSGDDEAVRASFALGLPAYYAAPEIPRDLNVKAYPDGRRELVRYVARGVEEALGPL